MTSAFLGQSFNRLRRSGLVILGLTARDAQSLPLARAEMFGQKNNLADVAGIVCDLAIDSLEHGVRLAADSDGAHHVFGFEGLKRAEYTRPSFFPPAHYFGSRGCGIQFKFLVAKAVGLLAIGSEEVGKARTHISG